MTQRICRPRMQCRHLLRPLSSPPSPISTTVQTIPGETGSHNSGCCDDEVFTSVAHRDQIRISVPIQGGGHNTKRIVGGQRLLRGAHEGAIGFRDYSEQHIMADARLIAGQRPYSHTASCLSGVD